MHPFGELVVPLVNIIEAGESGVGGLFGNLSIVFNASLNLMKCNFLLSVLISLTSGAWFYSLSMITIFVQHYFSSSIFKKSFNFDETTKTNFKFA